MKSSIVIYFLTICVMEQGRDSVFQIFPLLKDAYSMEFIYLIIVLSNFQIPLAIASFLKNKEHLYVLLQLGWMLLNKKDKKMTINGLLLLQGLLMVFLDFTLVFWVQLIQIQVNALNFSQEEDLGTSQLSQVLKIPSFCSIPLKQ